MHLLSRQQNTQQSTMRSSSLTKSNMYQSTTVASKNDAKLASIANIDPAALSKKKKMDRKAKSYHVEISLHYKADAGV